MYTIKYKPTNITDFVGNSKAITLLEDWLKRWDPINKKEKACLISGLNGIGKSLMTELVLKKYDYCYTEVSGDDERDKIFFQTTIQPLLKTPRSFNGQKQALIFNDIDGGGDYGLIANIIACIKDTLIPIICICDNRYDQNLKPITTMCFDLKMTKPTYDDVYRLVYNVIINEKIKVKVSELKALYEQSNGDVRFILNALQMNLKASSNKNIQSANMFDTTARLMNMEESINKKYDAYWLYQDLHTLMVQENYANNLVGMRDEVVRLNNMANAADALSDTDLFATYVNLTNWEMEPYVAMNTIHASSFCNKKCQIKFPQFLGKISTIYKNRREKKEWDIIIKPDDKPCKPVKESTAKSEPKAKKVKAEPKAKNKNKK